MTKLLITGSHGFFGSHLVDHVLRTTDWSIVCLDRCDFAGNAERLRAIPSYAKSGRRIALVHRDLRAEIGERMSKCILSGAGSEWEATPFDHIVHLAAASHVDRSVKDPLSFVQDNVVGTANLLDWVRTSSVLRHGGRLLNFSTDEVYGAAPSGGSFGEVSRFNPTNPYAGSKAAAECICDAYAATYGLPIVVSRANNIYGERQDREKFIPLVINAIQRGEKVLIHADRTRTVSSSRFYIHAEDVCAAVMHLLTSPDAKCLDGSGQRGKYNISGDNEYTNYSIAQRIALLLCLPLDYEMVDFVPGRPRHDMRYATNGSLLRSIGWTPRVSIEEGLRRVVDSMRLKTALRQPDPIAYEDT